MQGESGKAQRNGFWCKKNAKGEQLAWDVMLDSDWYEESPPNNLGGLFNEVPITPTLSTNQTPALQWIGFVAKHTKETIGLKNSILDSFNILN